MARVFRNIDNIHTMPAEELQALLGCNQCIYRDRHCGEDPEAKCKEGKMAWLEKEETE